MMKFRTQPNSIEIYQNESWSSFFVKGVNLGATLPGTYPGELPLNKEDYKRWFTSMKEMGANTVRIYTIHDPVFYETLVEFNREHPEDPLYFMQGVWSPVTLLAETGDAKQQNVTKAFKEEIERAVGAVYGDRTIESQPGKASGTYTANAAPYLVAWHIGTEWDPKMVLQTNEDHKGSSLYQGDHFKATKGATPFESWLAELLDYTAQLEEEKKWQHPMTFTNWVTTDPLEHPEEPLIMEDKVSVDATHIQEVDRKDGYFASFHAYPYYPDFLRLGEAYNDVRNDEGKSDAYKGYLRELREYHEGMPILITEFGVPSSQGIAHIGQHGRDQGGHSEAEQGQKNIDLYQQIVAEGYAGAALFTWQDEWFKKTWNTMPYVEDGRRAYWFNYLSSETSYGVIGMYPSKEDDITIDGKDDEWTKLKDVQTSDVNQAGIEKVSVTHDEGYVYLNITQREASDLKDERLQLGLQTLPGGSTIEGVSEGLEALVTLNGETGNVQLASTYDGHHRLYEEEEALQPKDENGFVSWNLPVSLKFEPPNTRYTHPFEDVTVGDLSRGDAGEFSSSSYQPQAYWQAKGKTVEVKIPWALLGFSDPSVRKVFSYAETGDTRQMKTETIDSLQWFAWKNKARASELEAIPYTWSTWNKVDYAERKKQSYYDMKEAYTK